MTIITKGESSRDVIWRLQLHWHPVGIVLQRGALSSSEIFITPFVTVKEAWDFVRVILELIST
ncbi:hypothetical protein CsSME_00032958 [Camellia sinensis var. sinensis]